MDKKKSKSITKMEYGVVVILDSLGTKGIWRDQDLTKIITRWESALNSLKYFIKVNSKKLKFTAKFNAFSDTIIVTFVGNSIEELLKGAGLTTGSFIGYEMMNDLFLRGSISVGNFIHTDNLILGPAVDEAAEFYEKDNWIGVSATPSAYSVLKRLTDKEKTDEIFPFIEYDIPRHIGMEKKGFALEFLWDYVQKNNENPELEGKNILEIAHHHLEKSSNPTGSDKWKNLLDFLYFLKSRY